MCGVFNRTLIIYRHQQAKAQHPQVAEGLKTLLEHSYRVCGLTPQTQPDPEFNTNPSPMYYNSRERFQNTVQNVMEMNR